ncbi:MAG: hypothetical protein EHM70_22765 [Chloroflexota bacterium]|nr:MAG: hypothetical protein EHM70_22765 [Chloroflexota bacterium]
MLSSELLNKYDLGYLFYPPRRESEPGHPRLDILFMPAPTGRHFDPHRVELSMCSSQHGIEFASMRHPWRGSESFRICAGQMDLEDHKGKSVEVFSFGGEVSVESRDEYTLCVLTSPAPIMSIFSGNSPVNLFTEEVEILLAQRRAARSLQPGEFDKRLASVDPLSLYFACLQAALGRYKRLPPSDSLVGTDYAHMLREEIKNLSEAVKHPYSLEEIL